MSVLPAKGESRRGRRSHGGIIGIVVLLGAALLHTVARADERILAFDSTVDIYADASVKVSESISVRAESRQIKRGIYRDIPTAYRDSHGNRIKIDFEVLQVLRDDRPEAWHIEERGDGVRVYIGHSERILPPGEYHYTLTYLTNRVLGYFDGHDEFYWNVTGNDWAFPIDSVSAIVRLPSGVPSETLQIDGYTGPRGAQGRDFSGHVDLQGHARFTTTRMLRRGEGLTVAVGFPKGHVHEPGPRERLAWLLRDNAGLAAGLAGGALVLGWYLFAWVRVGRDPEAGVIIPRYAPPAGFSPASMRFIRRMGYDRKAFSAALVNLAVKGRIEIGQDGSNYTLRKLDGRAPLAAGESALLGKLFDHGRSIDLHKRNHKKIQAALKAHQGSLRRDYEKVHFLNNRAWLLPGLLFSVVGFAVSLLLQSNDEAIFVGLFMTVWLTGWTFGVFALLAQLVMLIRAANSAKEYLVAVPIALFTLPFLGGELFGLGALAEVTSWQFVVLMLAILGINALFYQLLKAPTRAGRRLLDRIDGFRLYLDIAEGDELALRHPPEKTPELFERFLPYAIALDVETRWSERFASVLATAAQGDAGGYRPGWYRGSRWNAAAPGSFSSGLGNGLGSALASSSRAPGSSSGVGGGGSSGGGGGGGGGGGW